MATITKRGDKFTVRVRVKGISRCKSFDTKTQARAWATKTEADIQAGIIGNNSGKLFIDALDRYANEVSVGKPGARWEQVRIEAFKRLPFAHYKLSDVTTPRMAEWRDDRLKSVMASTVNREANLLSSIFEQARREWQWIDTNPMRDVRRPANPPHRERIFNDDEISRIVEQLGAEGKSGIISQAFLFALETGMRRTEITGLSWLRINIDRRTATLSKTKNGDSRDVPLSTAAIAILRQQSEFESPFPVTPDVLTELFGRACERLGIENAHFHDARATALTRLSQRLNVLELARMIGHRDLQSLQIYYRETAENLAAKLD